MVPLYYNINTNRTYTAGQVISTFGINPTTADVASLNRIGLYPVVFTEPPFDTGLYTATLSYTIVGTEAVQTYAATARPLPEAKENASAELKERGDAETLLVVQASGFSTDVLTAVSSQTLASRPTPMQDTLDALTAVTDTLGANLVAVSACTTVDEINNIVNKPTGLLFTGRGGGLGPEDLNVSYYNEFNSVSMTEAETELYVPGTATTIAYGSGGPGQFDSFGNCFNPGDYLMQIRETATSMVIAEFEVPLNPSGQNVPF
jgi:hypothetical protein